MAIAVGGVRSATGLGVALKESKDMRWSRFRLLASLALLTGLSCAASAQAARPPAKAVAAQRSSTPATDPAAGELSTPKVFHIAGIPGLKRNARGDLVLTDRALTFRQGERQRLLLPYASIRRVQLLSGDRHYPKATYGAAVAGGVAGALLILKKHKSVHRSYPLRCQGGGRVSGRLPGHIDGGIGRSTPVGQKFQAGASPG